MKYGFVFECWIDGPDYKVLQYLVNWIKPDVHFEPVTLGDKGVLLEECADSVDVLLKTGCGRVFIVWDLMPKYVNCDCIVEERNLIRQQLIDKNIPLDNVELIGIVPEDENVIVSSNRGQPVSLDGKTRAGQAFQNIARRLMGETIPFLDLEARDGFFGRLTRFIRPGGK